MTLRISVSGAFSTGKTTVIEAAVAHLADAGRSVWVIGEVARKVLATGYSLDRRATIESYLLYVRLQLEAEDAAREAPLVLSDRSLIDLLAYVLVNDDPQIPPEFVDLLAAIVRQETSFFDAYCYLPVEFPPIADGEREVDPAYQERVSQRLGALLRQYEVETIELRGSLDQRVMTLLEITSLR